MTSSDGRFGSGKCLRRWWLGLMGLTLALASGGPASGSTLPDGVPSSARSVSFGGHPLLPDVADIFTFPQLSLDHQGIAQMNVADGSLDGSALVIMGAGGNAYGASLHGHDSLRDSAVHLHWGMPMGDNRFGIGLSVGVGGTRTFPADEAQSNTGDRHWGFDLSMGYSLGRTDLSLQVGGDEWTDSEDGVDGIGMEVSLNARSLGQVTDGIAWGWTGEVSLHDLDRPEDGHTDYKEQTLNVRGGFGPTFHRDGAIVALQGVAGFNRISFDPDGNGTPDSQVEDDRTTTDTITVPGLELAGEFPVKDWLVLRASAGYHFDITTVTVEATKTTTRTFSNGEGFSWAAGAGLKYDNVAVDVVLKDGFVVNGPEFVGGAGGGLASQVSLNFAF